MKKLFFIVLILLLCSSCTNGNPNATPANTSKTTPSYDTLPIKNEKPDLPELNSFSLEEFNTKDINLVSIESDHFLDGMETDESGYILAEYLYDSDHFIRLRKYDENVNLEWEKSFNDLGIDETNYDHLNGYGEIDSILYKTDIGYCLIIGTSRWTSSEGGPLDIIWFDNNGNHINTENFYQKAYIDFYGYLKIIDKDGSVEYYKVENDNLSKVNNMPDEIFEADFKTYLEGFGYLVSNLSCDFLSLYDEHFFLKWRCDLPKYDDLNHINNCYIEENEIVIVLINGDSYNLDTELNKSLSKKYYQFIKINTEGKITYDKRVLLPYQLTVDETTLEEKEDYNYHFMMRTNQKSYMFCLFEDRALPYYLPSEDVSIPYHVYKFEIDLNGILKNQQTNLPLNSPARPRLVNSFVFNEGYYLVLESNEFLKDSIFYTNDKYLIVKYDNDDNILAVRHYYNLPNVLSSFLYRLPNNTFIHITYGEYLS